MTIGLGTLRVRVSHPDRGVVDALCQRGCQHYTEWGSDGIRENTQAEATQRLYEAIEDCERGTLRNA